MMFWGYDYGWPMMLWMVFWNFFWLALVGVAVWALVRWVARMPLRSGSQRPVPTEPSAQEILRQRYARGEIDTPTFEQMRAVLEGERERAPIEGR